MPVSDAEVIAHARKTIGVYRSGGIEAVRADETLREDFWAWIALGTDGVNRNLAASGAPEWHWHVSEVINIETSGGIELYYASPRSLELDAVDPDPSVHFIDGVALARFVYTLPVGEFPFPFDPVEGLEWKRSWVGWFYDAEYPWFFHGDFGWFCANGLDPENLWAWAHGKRAWVLLRESAFPWFYDVEAGSWRYYLAGEDGQAAWYFTATTETWSSAF